MAKLLPTLNPLKTLIIILSLLHASCVHALSGFAFGMPGQGLVSAIGSRMFGRRRFLYEESEKEMRAKETLLGLADRLDEELFARAREVEKGRSMGESAGGRAKVALMFLTKDELKHDTLWERWIKGHEDLYSIYIHAATPGFEYNGSTTKATAFYGRQVPSVESQWGGLALLRAERRILAIALAEPRNERFVLLSESCVPIWPAPYIYNYLTEAQSSYIGASHTWFRWHPGFLPEIPSQVWKKGSQWFSIIRDHAMLAINDTLIYNVLCERFADKILDEHYFQTLISWMGAPLVEPRPVTYVDWREIQGRHPYTFSEDEVSADTLRGIRERTVSMKEGLWSVWSEDVNCTVNGNTRNCFLFARKFPASSRLLQVADELQF